MQPNRGNLLGRKRPEFPGLPGLATSCVFKGVGGGAPISLPLVNAQGKPANEMDLRTEGFGINISVARGKPLRVVLDTGSLGVVIPASHAGPIDSKDIICPGRIQYSSRGIETYYGNWVMAEIGLGVTGKGKGQSFRGPRSPANNDQCPDSVRPP